MLFFSTSALAELTYTPSGIPLDKEWKNSVYQFSRDNLEHSAWGLAHCERNYVLAKKIAGKENVTIDEDVLFAASFLHDLGVFKPYIVEGNEHSRTAADNVREILEPSGFPLEKLEKVKKSILSHMFYADVKNTPEAKILHDADTLDFLGAIGAARIISITTRHPWAPSLSGAIETIEKFNRDLPSKLIFNSSKKMAEIRVQESNDFLMSLKSESVEGTLL